MYRPVSSRPACLLGVSLVALCCPIVVHAQSFGSLSGDVTSRAGAKAVSGAVVSIADSGASVVTTSDGQYTINGVVPGRHRVTVSVGNTVVAERTVVVAAGGLTRQSFTAAAPIGAASPGEAVEVFGRRNPAALARRKQLTALNSVNVQSAQEIAKYPDVSTAEALSRVPGVSMETDTGEGRFVNIRGIDADLNGYTFGGVVLPASSPASPFGGGRAVAFDAIPAGFVGQLEVTKTLRPDQDAQGLGGQIEITPKTVRPGDMPFVEGTLGSGLELLRDKPIAQGDLTAGASFGLDRSPFAGGYKPFSVLVTGDVYNDSRGVDDVEAAYTDQQSSGVPDKVFSTLENRRYGSYRRHRYGYGGELAFAPNVDNRWYIRYAESGYSEQVNRQRLIYSNLDNGAKLTDANGLFPTYLPDPANPNGFIAPASPLETTLRDEGETLRDKIATVGGENNIDGFAIDYHAAWAAGTYDKGHDYNSTFTTNPVAVAYDNTTNPNFPTRNVLTPGFDYLDPKNYAFSNLNNQSQHNADVEYSGALNVSHPLDLAGGDGLLKVGGSVRRRTRSATQQNQNYSPSAGNLLTLADLNGGGRNNVYYDKHYTVPTSPNSDQVRALIGSTLLTEDVGADHIQDLRAFERDREDVYAGYIQYSWHKGPVSILSGVRLERTEGSYGAYAGTADAAGNTTYAFGRNKHQYDDYFPTVQLRYEFTPRLIGRLSYSTAIARPGFNQISGARTVDLGAETITGGNPNLVPITLDNYEGSLSWFTPHSGILSVAAFDKELHNYIYPSSTRGPLAGVPGITFTTIGFANGGEARATGMEFDYHQKFFGLPGFLNGFGVDVNYTYVSSNGSIHPGQSTVLPSTASDTVNAAIFYEKYNIEARLAYDYVGQNLFAIGTTSANDIYSQPRGTLDLATQCQFSDHFKYYFNARNLLNTPLKFVEGGLDNRPIQREFYDVTLQTGLKFDF